MQFSTTFNAILALAIGSNAASINVRQSEPMTASINIYNTPDCTDLPQHGIELLSADIGKCGSYEWSLKGVMPYIFNGSCKFTVYSGADCTGSSTDVESFICAESGQSYKLTC